MAKVRIYPLVILALITFSSAEIIGCKGSSRNPAQELTDIPYGSDPMHRFDISLPGGRSKNTPLIMLIHGGAWTGGDKSDFNFLRRFFCKKGFAVVSVNYRLASVKGINFNLMLDDISEAVLFLREKSDTWIYSGELFFMAGHSAGGHVALMYAFTRDPGRQIRGVVSFCGVTDLTDPELKIMLDRMHPENVKPGGKPFDLIGFLTGNRREVQERYSPVYVVSRVPVLLFSGKLETIIPWTQSANLHTTMINNGFDSTLYIYPDMGHDLTIHYTAIMAITEKWIRARSGNQD